MLSASDSCSEIRNPLAQAIRRLIMQVMMVKEIPNCLKYTAWRRVLPNGKTEYKSLTVCPDATAEEFMDLYLDDDFRPQWDPMIIAHNVGCKEA